MKNTLQMNAVFLLENCQGNSSIPQPESRQIVGLSTFVPLKEGVYCQTRFANFVYTLRKAILFVPMGPVLYLSMMRSFLHLCETAGP